MQRSDFPKTICEAGWQSARRCMCDGPPGLVEWAFGPRNPMKNRALVGQPVLAAAVFQAAFSILRASFAEGTADGFSTLSPDDARDTGTAEVSRSMNDVPQ